MLAQINDGCAICRLVAQCVDPQIALRDLQIALRDRQIAQISRLRLTQTSMLYVYNFTVTLQSMVVQEIIETFTFMVKIIENNEN